MLVAALAAGALIAPGLAAAEDAAAARSAEYQDFLRQGRSAERAARVAVAWAARAGWRTIDLTTAEPCAGVRPGDGLIFVARERAVLLVRVGGRPLDGWRLVGGHIDAPALRLLAEPVRERGGALHLAAEAYGGLRPYHYRDRPLRLVGRVARAGGAVVDVDLGPEHGFALIAADADGARDDRGSRGESERDRISLIAGTAPGARAALEAKLGVRLDELVAGEVFAVAAAGPRLVGLGAGALIGAAGQDDRSLSYAALRAVLDAAPGARTAAALLIDREETGSQGPTGAQGPLLEEAVACVARAGGARHVDAAVRRTLAATVALSADVKSALDPIWTEVHDPRNTPVLGGGPTLVRATGKAGKQNASHAHAELSRRVIDLAARAGVPLQGSESGRVDEGGGGTIALYLAHRGIDVIDVGIPLLSMHAPLELVDPRDLSWACDLFRAFFEEK